MVGDRPEADIAGANRMGMPSIWTRQVTPPERVPRTGEEQPTHTIDRLRDLLDLDLFEG